MVKLTNTEPGKGIPPGGTWRLWLPFFCAVFTVLGCQTINRSGKQLQIPQGIVIFTFDDGPNVHENTTARLLDVLKKYGVRGMFALLGENVEHSPELVRRIHGEGHYIINHGFSDRFAVSMSDEEFYANLVRGAGAINAALGTELRPLLYRPQGGLYEKRHQKIWEYLGYTLVPVSARAYDAVLSAQNKGEAVQKIIKAVEKNQGGIIMLHDARDSHFRMEKELKIRPDGIFNRSWIPDAVEEIILILIKKGYQVKGFDIAGILNAGEPW
jgi:peptidoglycan/xylan/chitin deacetylase (PgdA/CDA1 family)